MPKIDLSTVPERTGSCYPAPFDAPCAARARKALGDAGGLTDFGVNLLRLPPGAWSSQRHWHSDEDEFVWVLSGVATLVTGEGRQPLKAGECAAFPKGRADGHHLVNESNAPVICLEVGTRSASDVCDYPDVDMRYDPKTGSYVRRDGAPYPKR
ncbi:MAG TPA: cupin domain-containing protein [Parvularculaceae bacterium]|nr:cupin domain-containing protein [Parvularculaceae bacterium]